MRLRTLIITLLLASYFCGCAKVEPWQKEILGKQIMAFDPDPLESKNKQHIYFSKEGSTGGYGLEGGGCGCN
jgi:hypothetical protein